MLCSFPYMIGVMFENAYAKKRQPRKESVERASRARSSRVELNESFDLPSSKLSSQQMETQS
jgi:hypothetical protein